MKVFTLPVLLITALFSAVLALPFMPAAKTQPDFFVFEVKAAATTNGPLQIFYDSGYGMREEESAHIALNRSTEPLTYRAPLVPGDYRALRVDPLERGATTTISSIRVFSDTGRLVADVPLKDFQIGNQIASLKLTERGLEITSAATSDDAQIALVLPAGISVHTSWRDHVRGGYAAVVFAFVGLLALLVVLSRAERFRASCVTWAGELALRPGRAVSLAAAIAVIASAYPVVFLGKSYVSPNLGTILLYDKYPTLPGYQSNELVDVKLSDIGAVMWQHVGFSAIQHRALLQGELPLWNRYNSGGVPLLAQGQSMFGDPLHLFVIAANGAAWAWDIKYLVAKWLLAVGLALTVMALWPRPPTGPPDHGALISAVLVALAAPFVGFFLYRINHPAFFSLCYAPWPLYFLVRIAKSNTRRALALGCLGLIVANIALMNSGTVKEAYMLLVCMNFSGGCVVLAQAASWRERLLKVAAVGWSGALFALLTAPIWATFLQTLRNAYTGYNAASAYQLQPTLLLGLFDEILYRPLMEKDQVYAPSMNFLLLAGVLYFAATLRCQFRNRAVVALAASSLVPLSLAFGFISPQWIVQLPFLGNIAHVDNTFSCVLIVLWSVLAGIGFATATQRIATREGRDDLVIGGLLLFALVFAWIAFRQAAHRPILGNTFTVHKPGQVLAVAPFIWDYLWAMLTAIVVLAIVVRGAVLRQRLGLARGLIVTMCLILLLWRQGLHTNAFGFEPFTARPTDRVNFHAKSEAMQFMRAEQKKEPSRGYGLHGNFFPGWTGMYGLETVHSPDALVNKWLRELVGVSGVERLWDWRLYADADNIGTVRPFFDALNVRYYFDLASDQGALGKALKLVKPADLDIYESPTAWPRAFFTDRLDTYEEPKELVEKIRAANGKPFAAVQRNDLAAMGVVVRFPGDIAARTVVPATNYKLTENNTSFTIHATAPGVVVLNEVLWPDDFRARLNGHATRVLRMNHAFKGVVIDAPGDYQITFRYWPRNFTRNLILCGIGALLLAGSFLLAWRSGSQPVRVSRE